MKKVSVIVGVVLLAALMMAGCGRAGAAVANGNTTNGPSTASYTNPATVQGDVQTITTKFGARSYAPITVQAGIPVKWTIQMDEKDLNGCNNEMEIPEYGITQPLQAGETVVEFVPGKAGTFPYSCWMGMIRSQIVVVDSLGESSSAPAASQAPAETAPASSQCAVLAQTPSLTGVVVAIAQVENGKGSVAVSMEPYGYQVDAIIVQRGMETTFQFEGQERTCATEVVFPQKEGVINLLETPDVTVVPDKDFTFQCSMGMYGVNVFVVDDLAAPETQNLKQTIEANPGDFRFKGGVCTLTGNGRGGGCCA